MHLELKASGSGHSSFGPWLWFRGSGFGVLLSVLFMGFGIQAFVSRFGLWVYGKGEVIRVCFASHVFL